MLQDAGISQIFCVQTKEDMAFRGVDWNNMVELYSKRNMQPTHFHIVDFNQEHLIERMYDAACEINRLR